MKKNDILKSTASTKNYSAKSLVLFLIGILFSPLLFAQSYTYATESFDEAVWASASSTANPIISTTGKWTTAKNNIAIDGATLVPPITAVSGTKILVFATKTSALISPILDNGVGVLTYNVIKSGSRTIIVSSSKDNVTWTPLESFIALATWSKRTIIINDQTVRYIKFETNSNGGTYLDDVLITSYGSPISVLTTDNVVFAGNYSVSTNLVCNNLTINSLAVLTINPNIFVTVNGTLINNNVSAGLVVKSDATGTGSLITNTISGIGTAKIERFLAFDLSGTQKKYYISSPVAAYPFATDFTTSNNIFSYDATAPNATQSANYISKKADPGNMAIGTGYVTQFPTGNVTLSYAGALNTGNIAVANLSGTSTNNPYGFNLIGNPYPSAFKWILTTNVILSPEVNNAYYIRRTDNTVGSYVAGVAAGSDLAHDFDMDNGIIPAGHAFWVTTNVIGGTSGTVTFLNVGRVHTSAVPFMKKGTTVNEVVRMSIENSGKKDDLAISFNELATSNFDGQFDALKMYSDDPAIPQLFSIAADKKNLSINSLPFDGESLHILIGYKALTNGNYSMNFNNQSSLAYQFILEDKLTNTIQNLSSNPIYNFVANSTSSDNRFNLKISKSTTSVNSIREKTATVYAYQQNLHVNFIRPTISQIDVIDLLGKVVKSAKCTNTENTISVANLKGVYIVRIKTEAGIYAEKVMVQ